MGNRYNDELTKELKDIKSSDIKMIIEILNNHISGSDRDKVLCQIKNLKGTLTVDNNNVEDKMAKFREDFNKIRSGEVFIKCYCEPTGQYFYGEEITDNSYNIDGKLWTIFYNSYELLEELINLKQYLYAMEVVDSLLFTNYFCGEVLDPDGDEYIAEMDFEFYEIEELIPFNFDTVRLYGAYAAIMINGDDMLEKLNKYLDPYQNVEDCQYLGVEKILNIKEISKKFENYRKKNKKFN